MFLQQYLLALVFFGNFIFFLIYLLPTYPLGWSQLGTVKLNYVQVFSCQFHSVTYMDYLWVCVPLCGILVFVLWFMFACIFFSIFSTSFISYKDSSLFTLPFYRVVLTEGRRLAQDSLSFNYRWLEFFWIVIPASIIFLLSLPTVGSAYYMDLCALGAGVAPSYLVCGVQWYWCYEHNFLLNK